MVLLSFMQYSCGGSIINSRLLSFMQYSCGGSIINSRFSTIQTRPLCIACTKVQWYVMVCPYYSSLCCVHVIQQVYEILKNFNNRSKLCILRWLICPNCSPLCILCKFIKYCSFALSVIHCAFYAKSQILQICPNMQPTVHLNKFINITDWS